MAIEYLLQFSGQATTLLAITLLAVIWLYALDPLHAIPGPIVARFSPLWLTYQSRRVRRSQSVQELHDNYGKLVRIAPNSVSIADPNALQQIYGHKPIFVKGPFYEDMYLKLSPRNSEADCQVPFHQIRPVVFTARDPQVHATKRKFLNPGFSGRALSAFEPRMSACILNLKKSFLGKARSPSGVQVDFCVWSNYLAFDAIADFSFGKPFGFVDSGKDPESLVRTIDNRGEVLNALGTLPVFIRPWMKYYPFDKFWGDGLSAKSSLEQLARASFQQRKSDAQEHNDLLSLLFSAKDPGTGAPIVDAEIIAEAISFIVGGSDTTSSTMTHFVDLVSRNHEVQKKLQDELDASFPGDIEEDWVAPDSVVKNLPFLNAALKETMRLRPTSSTGLERIVPPGGQDIAGRHFAAGTLVSVPTATIMHDPAIFERPYEFLPDRWLATDSSKLNQYFHPFSLGPRSCIGRSFAWLEMTKTLATLFRTFTFRRVKEEPTALREGFFLKAEECEVAIHLR